MGSEETLIQAVQDPLGVLQLLPIVVLIAFGILVLRWRRKRAKTPPLGHLITSSHSSKLPPKKPSAGHAPTKVFLAYRREDSADVTGRIYDKLIYHLGKAQVFKDVDSVPFGIDFRKHLDQVVGNCEVMFVVIGDRWLTAEGSKGVRRLDDPGDLVRIEIASALSRDIPVVPVLVKGAKMPKEADLPDSIKAFAYRNGTAVREDPDFHADMDRLLSGLGLQLKA